jgi:hypothetical protein
VSTHSEKIVGILKQECNQNTARRAATHLQVQHEQPLSDCVAMPTID